MDDPRCPHHPQVVLDAMWDKDATPQVAWRCDLCRALYDVKEGRVVGRLKWRERDAYYGVSGGLLGRLFGGR